ncbi:hypothetical protein [Veillonella criceti]|uniref:Uncharacterized protein n=1 Tax=Veillonella criceti TaxID=103891 RepID=A0A380NKY4_9FIRM|nr:hypothetical protein [Veillonella criceti]SUP42218.1 Uncharacterised protein [Veillonella criceti]
MDKQVLIDKVKRVYNNIRIANIKPTGVLATRALVGLLLVPILVVIMAYVMAFYKGTVSDDTGRVIDVGIKIVDHFFIPTVLTAIVGFLALWIDKNHNGIPDKLEDNDKKPL